MAEQPFRVLPRITPRNGFFWKSGADGKLRFRRCTACSHYVHPPSPRCPDCLGEELSVEAVSGRGTVMSFTVNHQRWAPGEHPYVVAIVELEEQPGLRLMSNVVNCPVEDVHIDLPVQVVFEAHGEIFIPLFEPAAS